MLTKEDLNLLQRVFPFDEHYQNQNGFWYIKEDAITSRIEEVDPAWALVIKDMGARDKTVSVVASLTINGVTRDGVGSQMVEYTKNNPDREAGEPEKSAATDALRRAARLFGVGRYLLGAPKDATQFKKWLTQSQPATAPVQRQQVDNIVQAAFAGKKWTEYQAKVWAAKAMENGATMEDILSALEVTRLGEFNGSAADATRLLSNWQLDAGVEMDAAGEAYLQQRQNGDN